ncbi:MAG: ribosomal protein S18-alanine N-acetyltransferase [Candidatus Thorarchaeota archaeon]|jgi:ribosomal-protein-alanine N-acetyltransferase
MTRRVIRVVSREDVPLVITIERSSFPRPWDEDIFRILGSWRGHVRTQRRKTVFMYVIEDDDELAGYVVWEEDVESAESHLLNIAIRQQSRRRGMGRELLDYALETMREHKMASCRLEVRESNTPAQALYVEAGMSILCRDSAYYEDEDALVFTIML